MKVTAFADPSLYVVQIDRIFEKYSKTGRLEMIQQEGATLAHLIHHKSKLARLVASEIRKNTYEFSPAVIKKALIGSKERDLYNYKLTDLLVHGVFSYVLHSALLDQFSPRLYSYQKGRSTWTTLCDFSAFVRKYRHSIKDPKARGLYVLRRDVKQYSDSVPLDGTSPLWPLLHECIARSPLKNMLKTHYWDILCHVIRTEIISSNGIIHTATKGIPTGSPINTVITNLYLMPLDRHLDQVSGSFYARYGDDFIFCHTDPDIVEEKSRSIPELLSTLRLQAHSAKQNNIYFTGAGRHSPRDQFHGSQFVPYLGCRTSFEGTISLDHEKVRLMMQHLRKRVRSTLVHVQNKNLSERGGAMCHAINQALRPDSATAFAYSNLLAKAVTDRHQLRQMDFAIAKFVQNTLTGIPGVRGFRKISIKRMRREWGLLSLEHQRNLYRKHGKT